MLLLTVTEFRSNISQYLHRALTEHIAVKTKEGVFDITPNSEIRTNPSPSNDPWFNDPRNMELLERGKREAASGLGMPFDEFKRELEL